MTNTGHATLREFMLDELKKGSPELYENQMCDMPFKKTNKYSRYPFDGPLTIQLDSLIPSVDWFYMGDFKLLDATGIIKCNNELHNESKWQKWHAFAIDESMCMAIVNDESRVKWIVDGHVEKEWPSITEFITLACRQSAT